MRSYTKDSIVISDNLSNIVTKSTAYQKPLIELTAEQKKQLKTVAGITLSIIAAAGVITVAAAAPNVFLAVEQIQKLANKSKLNFKAKQTKTARTFYYLKRYGLIQLESSPKGLMAKLTNKGIRRLEKLNFETIQIPKEKRWNGKWWLIAADILTKDYRWAADLFRMKVRQMGLCPLQRTMWFYPYNPAREIEFLSQHYDIGQFVTVMEVSRLDKDDEQKLKKHFKL